MASQNIKYQTQEILDFYSSHRQAWSEFYPSEKWIFERVAHHGQDLGDVLDVGCAGGGLGAALCERFQLRSYTGIDIHSGIIEWAKQQRQLPVPAKFYADDINTVELDQEYDLVCSLGCADWNIETAQIVQTCWERVKVGGHFVLSLRLTTQETVNDMSISYQNINFSGNDPEPELANYVVTNYQDAIRMLTNVSPNPDMLGAYGYWGKPSTTAVTPFEKILFGVFYLRKGEGSQMDVRTELHFPADVYTGERE